MRLPWSRGRVVIEPAVLAAQQSVMDAQRRLDAANADDSEVHRVVRELRELRQRNHFRARLGRMMRESHP